MQGKFQEWEMQDQILGLGNAGPENVGRNVRDGKFRA